MPDHHTQPVWLFIATQPSSGSTLLADLLFSIPGVGCLEPRAEGQWLIPDLIANTQRWDPSFPADFSEVRRLWTKAAFDKARGSRVIVEKSPPNLCRMSRLLDAFSDRPTHLLLLTRDPFAMVQSWMSRYPRGHLLKVWFPETHNKNGDMLDFYRLLGRLCGERFAMLESLRSRSDGWISYEAMVRNPIASVRSITRDLEGFEDFEADSSALSVLGNRNALMRAELTAESEDAIRQGLAPFAASVEVFGYSLD